jgi:hypothetical protein
MTPLLVTALKNGPTFRIRPEIDMRVLTNDR